MRSVYHTHTVQKRDTRAALTPQKHHATYLNEWTHQMPNRHCLSNSLINCFAPAYSESIKGNQCVELMSKNGTHNRTPPFFCAHCCCYCYLLLFVVASDDDDDGDGVCIYMNFFSFHFSHFNSMILISYMIRLIFKTHVQRCSTLRFVLETKTYVSLSAFSVRF